MKYNRLLGEWWYSTLIDQPYGCRIHNDATPVNYLFNHKKVYALDFESSWDHANFVHDLGIVAAELKHYFAK
jgi:Ser/Thr protein kinase RdoA (MazF antagonist)